MARRDFRRGAVAIRQSRLTTWFQFTPVATTITGAGGNVIFSLNAAALALRPFTVVRSRFMCKVVSDQEAATESQIGAWGIAVVSDQAVAIGVTAVPTPITDMGSNLWLLHQLYMAGDTSAPRGEVYETDSKAMRKVEIGQDLVVVVELSAAGDGQVVTIGGRMLVKNN